VECDQDKAIHLRFAVLRNVVNVIAEGIFSDTLLKENGILKFLTKGEAEEKSSHVIKIGNVIVGAVWKQRFNPGLTLDFLLWVRLFSWYY
jgi:hypothetical protein